MSYSELVADSALELWFPDGFQPGRTIKEHSYDDDVVKTHVMPLVPTGSTQVEALAICIDPTKQDVILSSELNKLNHELDRVELWSSHPIGWRLANVTRPHGREMTVGVPADGSRMDQAWAFDKKQGVKFIFHRKAEYFMTGYEGYKEPLSDHHWCVLVTYRLPLLRVKPQKVSKAMVETMLTGVIKTFTTEHATAMPNAKKLKEVAKKRHADQRCTVFEFLNAYQLDAAAKGDNPLKLPPPPPRSKAKGNQDVVGPTDDEGPPEDEEEAVATEAAASVNGKKRKRSVKPKVVVEPLCRARRWLAHWANKLDPEVMIRVTDAPFPKDELLRACRGETVNTYLSNAQDVVNALLAFIDGPEAPTAWIKPRCVDLHNTIPCDAFNQRTTITEEMTRVCDRFVLRLKAMRRMPPAQRASVVQCTTPIPNGASSGLLREEGYKALEHVTQLELAAILGVRQVVQWRTSLWSFYAKALEPLHGEEVHASLEICQDFFERTLNLFTQRVQPQEVSPPKPKAKPKPAAASAATHGKPKTKAKPSSAAAATNGKSEVVSDSGSGSDTDDSSSSSSGSSSSDEEDESGQEEEEEPPLKKKAPSADEDIKEAEKETQEAIYERQFNLLMQRVETVTQIDPDEAAFSRAIFPRKHPDPIKQDPLKNPMELNGAIHGFFRRLCEALGLQECTSRLGDGGRSSAYLFRVPQEPESYLVLPFDPFAAAPNGVDLRNGVEAIACMLLSSKPKSQLEKAYLDIARRSTDVHRFLEGMELPKPKPIPKPDEPTVSVPMETDA